MLGYFVHPDHTRWYAYIMSFPNSAYLFGFFQSWGLIPWQHLDNQCSIFIILKPHEIIRDVLPCSSLSYIPQLKSLLSNQILSFLNYVLVTLTSISTSWPYEVCVLCIVLTKSQNNKEGVSVPPTTTGWNPDITRYICVHYYNLIYCFATHTPHYWEYALIF